MNKMAETWRIRVCVLEGQLVELADAGVPFSICLHMQQLGLALEHAQWSTRQTSGGLSISLFWPSSQASNVKEVHTKKKHERRKKAPKVTEAGASSPTATSLAPASICQ